MIPSALARRCFAQASNDVLRAQRLILQLALHRELGKDQTIVFRHIQNIGPDELQASEVLDTGRGIAAKTLAGEPARSEQDASATGKARTAASIASLRFICCSDQSKGGRFQYSRQRRPDTCGAGGWREVCRDWQVEFMKFLLKLDDMQDSLAATNRPQCGLMSAAQFLKTRVSPDTKKRVHALAQQQLITESMWLKSLVAAALRESPSKESAEARVAQIVGGTHRDRVLDPAREDNSGKRICVRLRPDDRLLLRERAVARGMPLASYVSVLVRAHLRNLAPLPKDELVALKRSVAELGAIGRNLNQIARAANSGNRVVGPAREDLRGILKVCEALRDNVKGLIKANVNAWEWGHAEAES